MLYIMVNVLKAPLINYVVKNNQYRCIEVVEMYFNLTQGFVYSGTLEMFCWILCLSEGVGSGVDVKCLYTMVVSLKIDTRRVATARGYLGVLQSNQHYGVKKSVSVYHIF